MNWLLEQLECCDFAENHEFYIDGFPDLTRQHMAIVCHLIRMSPMVTVCLTTDAVGSQHPGFEKAGQTARELVAECKRMEIPVQIQVVPGRQDALAPVRELLFQGRIEAVAGLETVLYPGRSDSVFDECQSAAE